MIGAVNRTESALVKDLVLVGGGHAHLGVLKSFGMRPPPGTRLTLICNDAYTAYSGMLPGHVAGHYQLDQTRIDVRLLSAFAHTRFCQTRAIGFNLSGNHVICAEGPPFRFDLLSINIGSTPSAQGIPGAREHAFPVKPIDRFLEKWRAFVEQVQVTRASRVRIAIVGGGAGGVELALATRHRLSNLRRESGCPDQQLESHLVTASPTILPSHNRAVQTKFNRILGERGIQLHLNSRVTRVDPACLVCESGQTVDFDALFWATHASCPGWLSASGLRTDADGFVVVNDCLQSVSHPSVFAAGDVAAAQNHPRPKSGVFAVRQGPLLSENLRRALANQTLKPFSPQTNALSLISAGDRYAVASRGRWSIEGPWVWRWKDWIDRRWIRQYQDLPDPTTSRAHLG